MKRNIEFSPPDITELEISYVVETLKSGWITTGPKTKLFENKIAEYCATSNAVCLNSATAALELTLKILGIGQGDEVITSAYTYTATASVVEHVGAKIVLVDTQVDSFEMDYQALERVINSRTKAIIPVDVGGFMCDYEKIKEIVENKKNLFSPSTNSLQKELARVVIIADAAHSFGAYYKGIRNGVIADFTCFSFHAVKNLTTAEGGAVVWRNINNISNQFIYNQYMLYSLHGQSKDALAKTIKGSWEYDIIYPAYKCNMTDILSSIGLAQLERYNDMILRRKEIVLQYNYLLNQYNVSLPKTIENDSVSSFHLYMLRINDINAQDRNFIISEMAKQGISCNVHYKPLPMLTAYKSLGFDIKNFPNALHNFETEITLPLHTLLSDDDVKYVSYTLGNILTNLHKANIDEKHLS